MWINFFTYVFIKHLCSFHSYPASEEILTKWKINLPPGTKLNENFRICSKHFNESDLNRSGGLFYNSVPTKFHFFKSSSILI